MPTATLVELRLRDLIRNHFHDDLPLSDFTVAVFWTPGEPGELERNNQDWLEKKGAKVLHLDRNDEIMTKEDFFDWLLDKSNKVANANRSIMVVLDTRHRIDYFPGLPFEDDEVPQGGGHVRFVKWHELETNLLAYVKKVKHEVSLSLSGFTVGLFWPPEKKRLFQREVTLIDMRCFENHLRMRGAKLLHLTDGPSVTKEDFLTWWDDVARNTYDEGSTLIVLQGYNGQDVPMDPRLEKWLGEKEEEEWMGDGKDEHLYVRFVKYDAIFKEPLVDSWGEDVEKKRDT